MRYLFLLLCVACGSPEFRTETMGENPSEGHSVTYLLQGGSPFTPAAEVKDASADVDIAACQSVFDICLDPCLKLPNKTTQRKACIDNCLHEYRVCTNCPLGGEAVNE